MAAYAIFPLGDQAITFSLGDTISVERLLEVMAMLLWLHELRVAGVLGIAGAVVGGWVLGLILPGRDMGPTGFIGAILGALLLLWLYRMFAKRRTV